MGEWRAWGVSLEFRDTWDDGEKARLSFNGFALDVASVWTSEDRGVVEPTASLLEAFLGSRLEAILGFGPRFLLRALYSQVRSSARQFEHCDGSASHLTLRRLHASHACVTSLVRILATRADIG